MPAKIVIAGSFNTDLVTYMPALPQIGETVTGTRFVTGPGGKGSNQAVAAARLGADVTLIGRVGQDSFAQIGLKLWQDEGIHTRYVVEDPEHATGIASIFVEEGGEDMIALAPGANHAIQPADIDAAEAAIAAADVLLVQLEIPLAIVEHALRLARKHGVTTVLNPAPAAPLSGEILALADYLTPNETEIEKLCDGGGQTLKAKAESLLASEQQTIIVTLGAWGALWVRQDAHGHVAAYEVEAVDSVGAGDAFNGGLALALAEGQTLQAAIRSGNAAAALAVQKKGAAASMPTRAELEAFLETNPIDEG